MTTYPGSPKLNKAGIIELDPQSSQVIRIITLQYNPIKLTRSLQVQSTNSEGGDRSEALRLKGPPVETIQIEAEIDATDQPDFLDLDGDSAEKGITPHLAALETLVYPESAKMISNNALASSGKLEIIPMEAPLTLFVWGKQRVLPVRLTEFSVTEDAFDPDLNPLRATVSLGMRVLTVDDLGFSHKGGNIFMSYLQAKEEAAGKFKGGDMGTLGIGGIG